MVLFGLALIFAALRQDTPNVKDNSVLTLRVAGSLPDYVPDDPLRRFFGGTDQSLSQPVTAVQESQSRQPDQDHLLDIDMSGAGWGKSEEIRDAIADFRSSGKPVYAYMEYGHEQGVLHRHAPATKFICRAAGRVVHQRSRRGCDVLSRLARQARHLS